MWYSFLTLLRKAFYMYEHAKTMRNIITINTTEVKQ